jgi:hypothetical protein
VTWHKHIVAGCRSSGVSIFADGLGNDLEWLTDAPKPPDLSVRWMDVSHIYC